MTLDEMADELRKAGWRVHRPHANKKPRPIIRCRPSPSFPHTARRRRERGTIVGEGRDGTTWRIIWDGFKEIESCHKSFVRIILPTDDVAESSVPVGALRCTGCGSTETLEEIRARHPGAIACCPERDLRPQPVCECPLPYRAIKPETHEESCPVVRGLTAPARVPVGEEKGETNDQ